METHKTIYTDKELQGMAAIIEKVLLSFGLVCRVVEIDYQENGLIFAMEPILGCSLEEIERHDKDLALALASPNGQVKMIMPIPGRALFGIELPYPKGFVPKNADNYKVLEVDRSKRENASRLARVFYWISDTSKTLATKL